MAEAHVKDQFETGAGTLEVDAELVDDIAVLLESGQRAMVINLISDLHPADLAQLIAHLPIQEARQLFAWLPVEQGGDILPELDTSIRNPLLEEMNPEAVSAMLDELDTDDATDIVADLPFETAEQIVPLLEAADDVRHLLGYDEESAGGIMGREYVSAKGHWTIAEVIEEVRRMAETMDQVYVVYIVDEAEQLEGFVTLRQLLLARADTRVDEMMRTDLVSVPVDMDQEEVARIMERYDLVALPVVDSERRLVGRITIDDVVDVIREEAEEDIQLMSGVTGGEEPTDSVLRITRGRLPWLLVGLVGAGLSGFVIGGFESALEEAVILAAFIPIMMATAGNVGIQSSSIIVQGLASGDVWTTDVIKRLWKETRVALINGIALAIVLGAAVLALPFASSHIAEVIHSPVLLALTTSLSLLGVIIIATVIGTTVPLFLHRGGIDPAIATGPFITTSNDIIGLTVYFLIATFIYL